ncbi:MAG: hypothetical protein KGZ79_09070 [Dethiobacter sp.]|jgi:methionine synthase II (cobalamin-independent)|nr:hypothetical protein [Dethiobacter sp.]
MDIKLYGCATAIGSLPHKEPAGALKLIFEFLPDIPHWPQLPAGGEDEGFVRQYLNPLLSRGLLKTETGRSPFFDTGAPDWLERLTAFYSEVLEPDEAVDRFGFPRDYASGFYAFLEHLGTYGTGSALYLKGQLSGPVTIGFQLTDAHMQPAFYLDELRDVLVRSLALQVRWQSRALAAFGLPVILFIDDPSIINFGQSTFVGLSRQAVKESLLPLIEAAHAEGALAGVHACAGVDWSLLFELPFDIVNIDVYHYFTSLLVYARELDSFLERGGVLAFGIVPTSDEVEAETARSLLDRLEEYMAALERKHVNGKRLRKQMLLTPSCGTGTLSESQAQRVYQLLQQAGTEYRR